MYQYSVGGNWAEPHFEKIMSVQAENMRIYTETYALWLDSRYLQTANKINYFLTHFLMSPDGVFYTSQDADIIQGQHSSDYFKRNDIERRKLGIPRIDKHIYARENGWVINALAHLYMGTGNLDDLAKAEHAAQWIADNRSLPDGGFSHDAEDIAGPYLGDTLSNGQSIFGTLPSNRYT